MRWEDHAAHFGEEKNDFDGKARKKETARKMKT
jgi:hypothetical protein